MSVILVPKLWPLASTKTPELVSFNVSVTSVNTSCPCVLPLRLSAKPIAKLRCTMPSS
ncbi:Uncharacterised protein [Vibrio cholerae]|nr:Uncharacterised protein [Vibrio cholerae]